MRSIEDILNDFEICFINARGCDGCSYYKDGYCTDEKDNNLSKEVFESLKLIKNKNKY